MHKFFKIISNSKISVVGVIICLPFIIMAIFAPYIAPFGPLDFDMPNRLKPPSADHLLGTDIFGRDILSRVIYGARVSLEIGFTSLMLGLILGFIIGILSGYMGGLFDNIIMRFMDAILSFPAILLALVMVAIFEPGMFTVMTAIAILRVPIFARTVRASVLKEKEQEYIIAANCIGQNTFFIILLHIIPNIISPILVLATSFFASGIVIEASLSFLGLGVASPDVSWGTMLSETRELLEVEYYWIPLFPGLALSLTVLGFNLLGDGIRDLLDPKIRKL